jgi:hypothetical protein
VSPPLSAIPHPSRSPRGLMPHTTCHLPPACSEGEGYPTPAPATGVRIALYGDSQTRTLYAGVDAWVHRIHGGAMAWTYHFTNEESIQAW